MARHGRAGKGADRDLPRHAGPDQIPPPLRGLDGLRFVLRPTSWQWGSWYNRTPVSAFVSGNMFRLHAHNELARVATPLLPRGPVALIEISIDPDGNSSTTRGVIRPAGIAAALADYLPRSLDDTGVWIDYPRSVAMTFDHGAGGRLTLRTIETTFTAAGCGC